MVYEGDIKKWKIQDKITIIDPFIINAFSYLIEMGFKIINNRHGFDVIEREFLNIGITYPASKNAKMYL